MPQLFQLLIFAISFCIVFSRDIDTKTNGTVNKKEPFITTSYGYQMRLNLEESKITRTSNLSFDVIFVVENDNKDNNLPTSFKRWWHAEILALEGGETVSIVF